MSDFQQILPPAAGLTDLSDTALLRRYAENGDQRAFAELVRRHSGWVISISKRRCGAAELAQESAQNVFLTLSRKAPRLLLGVNGLAPWLHRAAVLETAALLRRESRYRKAMKRHQDEFTVRGTGMDEAGEGWRGMRESVDEALNALAGRDREVLILHHVQGRTFQEIAQNLGRPKPRSSGAGTGLSKSWRRDCAGVADPALFRPAWWERRWRRGCLRRQGSGNRWHRGW